MVNLGDLANKFNVKLKGDPSIVIKRVSTIVSAQEGAICFYNDSRYLNDLKDTCASAVILSQTDMTLSNLPCLITDNPKLLFAQITAFLNPKKSFESGIHSTAVIHESAVISKTASIGPYVFIGKNTQIADNVIIEAGCYVSDDVIIGSGAHLFSRVSIYHQVSIGQSCTIHSGAVIGSDGFGFASESGRWVKIPQVGGVVIENNVEIGANCTIDRGALEDTIIGQGCILDNLIQVGHNVKIGAYTAIAACVAIGGSAVIGKHCLIGGGSIINGHLTVSDNVHLAGNSQVANSIKKPGAYGSAITAREINKWRRNLARFHSLDELSKRVKQLETKDN